MCVVVGVVLLVLGVWGMVLYRSRGIDMDAMMLVLLCRILSLGVVLVLRGWLVRAGKWRRGLLLGADVNGMTGRWGRGEK